MNFEPTDQDIVVDADELREFGSRLYQKAGVPKADADAVAHLQVETDLHGIHSHGTRALAGYVRGILGGRINPPLTSRLCVKDPHLHASTAIVVWDMWLASFQWS